MKSRYVVISPVRNEARYIEHTLNAVINQTIRPTQWIIVDDGSSDSTTAIVKRYQKKNPWIILVSRPDRGYRKIGSGVVEAFYSGFSQISKPWDFVVKLDGDISFAPDYFKELLKRFSADSNIGMASGQTFVPHGSKLVWERVHPNHVCGQTKMYRKKCFESIGALVKRRGWDCIDEIRAQMLGWETRNYATLKATHYRPTASSTGFWLTGKFGEGKSSHYVGYHPLFAIARGLRQTVERPYLFGGLTFILGYMAAAITFAPRYPDKKLRTFLRKQQKKRLWDAFNL